MYALMIEPGHGSVWLSDAKRITGDDGKQYIQGLADGDEYPGKKILMTFPANLLLKWEQ